DGVLRFHEGAATLGGQLLESTPGEPARQDVAVFPATDSREGHAQRMCQAFLGKTRAVTPGTNELASVGGRTAGNAGVGGGGVELHSEVHLWRIRSNCHASYSARRILTSGPRKGSKVARSCHDDTARWSFPALMHGPLYSLAASSGGWYAKVVPGPLPTPNELLERLKTVAYPAFTRDIVSFGLVPDIGVSSAG